jgi:hypothetical protein
VVLIPFVVGRRLSGPGAAAVMRSVSSRHASKKDRTTRTLWLV